MQIDDAVAHDLSLAIELSRQSGDVALTGVLLGMEWSGAFDRDCIRGEAFGGITCRDFSADALARPPFFIEDPHLQVMFLGGLQADVEIAIPALAEPVLMRAGFRGEAAVATLGHLVEIHLQPLFAFVPVQPEERPRQAFRLHWQFTELLFNGAERWFARRGARGD